MTILAEPQWEVVLAPVHKVKMQADMKQKVAPIEEHRQDTEPSKRLVVDLNTGLLKEYIGQLDNGVDGYMLVLINFFFIYRNDHC